MKPEKILLHACLLAATVIAAGSCEKNEVQWSEKVSANVSVLNFEAQDAAPQTITVTADGKWVSEAPDWITVDPATGEGSMDVSVSVADNVSNGVLDVPRVGDLVFKGESEASVAVISVVQAGDEYYDITDYTVSEAVDAADGTVISIPTAQVAAVTAKGCIITDGTANLYVDGLYEVAIGDKISIVGTKGSINTLPAVTEYAKYEVAGNTSVAYPSANDITEILDSYESDSREYISVKGTLYDGFVYTGTTVMSVSVMDPAAGLNLSAVEGHMVTLTGYYAGTSGSTVSIMVSGVADLGEPVRPDTPLKAEWLFLESTINDYMPTFGMGPGNEAKQEGTGGRYVASNVSGNGKIEYYSIDKTEIDVNNKFERTVGSTGHPFVFGAWPGDYWIFSVSDGWIYKSGSEFRLSFITRVSGTGMKYWIVEYFDGKEWQPAFETKSVDVDGKTVIYNVEMYSDGKTNVSVDFTFKISEPMSNIRARMRCLVNTQANGKGALAAPNGGTSRIAGDETGTSPVFEVVNAVY